MPNRKKTPNDILAGPRQVPSRGRANRDIEVSINAIDPNEQVSVPVSIVMSRTAANRLRAFMAHGQNRFVVSSSDGALSVRMSMVIARTSATEEIVAQLGSAAIDWDRGTISKDGRSAPLSRTELRLLACLVEHAGATVPHDILISSAWGVAPDDAGYNALAVYVCYLRRSLKSIGLGQSLRTARGIGYSLGDPLAIADDPSPKARNARYRPSSARALVEPAP